MNQTLHVQLLGGFRLQLGEKPLTTVDTPRLQSLLAFLLLHRDAPRPRRQVAFALWPDSSESQAQTNLRKQLHHLRQALPDSGRWLSADFNNLRWRRQAPLSLDVAHFEAAMARAEKAQTRTALRKALQTAATLYRGDLLPGCTDEWILPERERLYQSFVGALERLIRVAHGERDYQAAITYARHLLQREPLREATYRRLMRLYALEGDRASALKTYERCTTLLREELDVAPAPATRRLHERLLAMAASGPGLHNLPPQTTSFVGRGAELAEIDDRLRNPNCRLLTLVGPGGIGKTRLALQTASQATVDFLHGITFVPLAATRTADDVTAAMAEALNFSFYGTGAPLQQLFDYLRQKELLLILDNFEHLMPAVDLLPAMLNAASGVKLLVTSRRRLNLQEEWLVDVPGLPVPQLPAREEHRPQHYGAVRLFLERARQIEPAFSLGAEAPDVVRICRLLEGIPLGIELAAAWVRTLSCREIAQEIEAGLDILATSLRNVPERHRSLRAVFDHSWRLLTAQEQDVFRQLAVFHGGFSVEAATDVAGAAPSLLEALADKSLLRREAPGRYGMHDLLRQYAAEKLDAHPEEARSAAKRQCDYYVSFLERHTPHLRQEGQKDTLATIGREEQNVRAAWEWALQSKWTAAVTRCLPGLARFYMMKSRFQDGERLLAQAMAQLPESGAIFSKVRTRRGHFLENLGRYEEARALLQESLAYAREHGHREEEARALRLLGAVAYRSGELSEGRELLRESLPIYRKLENREGMATVLNDQGLVARQLGRYAQAKTHHEESLRMRRQLGDRRGTAAALNNLGIVAGAQGAYVEAREYLEKSLAMRREVADRWGMALTLNNLGLVARLQGKVEEAEAHFRESLAIRRETGNRWAVAIVLNNLGLLAHTVQDYGQARQLYEESLAIRREIDDRPGIASCLTGLGEVALALGQSQTAAQRFREALRTAMAVEAVPLALESIVGMAPLCVEEGRERQAAAFLALALHHPAGEKATRDKAERILADLASRLPADLVDAAREGQETIPLEEAAAEILSA